MGLVGRHPPSQYRELRMKMLSVKIGYTHVGYKVVAVRKSTRSHLSIVLAEEVTDGAPTQFVVWRFDHSSGGGFKSGVYRREREDAQKIFDSLEY